MIRQMLKWILMSCGWVTLAQAQTTLTIDSCYAMANRNYPMVQQYALIEQSKEYSIDNANKSYLPQISIAGQATHQSEVTALPISLPNMTIEPLSKDQYKLYGEVSEPVTDLFLVKDQRDLVAASADIEQQKLEVDLYALRERINGLFFGILLLDAQIEQTLLLKKDIQSGIDKTNTAVANGVAIKSSADNLLAEMIKADQRLVELRSNRKAYAAMLSLFIGKTIDEQTVLQAPPVQTGSNPISRPELRLFNLQRNSYDVQGKLIAAKLFPRVSVFIQGGFGRPGLNMLSNELSPYYIGGLRLNWNITNFYTYKRERQLLTIRQTILDVQQETFLFNVNLTLQQQNADIQKAQELIEMDKKIIALRASIKQTTQTQLENGTATTSDYLTAVNAQDQAQMNLLLHQTQLLMSQYNSKTTSGN